jgi:ribosomal protein S1
VHGYVRSAQSTGKGSGLFVALSATQTARVKLRMMADEYVDDPVAAFPAGKHVQGRIVEVSGDRVELSLKSTQLEIGGWLSLNSLTEGQVCLNCAFDWSEEL